MPIQMGEEECLNKSNDCWGIYMSILTLFLSFCRCGNEALQELNDKMTWLFNRFPAEHSFYGSIPLVQPIEL